jgi:transcription initiation factor TFIIB
MASTKDKLGVANPVMERAAYYYRKSLYNEVIKGRSFKEMVVASIWAACKEMGVPSYMDYVVRQTQTLYLRAGVSE